MSPHGGDVDVEREAIESEPNGKGRRPASKRNGSASLRVASEHDDRRPVIMMSAGELHVAIDEGIGALRADDDIYQREGKLVHVTWERGHEPMADSAPQIHEMSVDTLRERLTRHARWMKWNLLTESWVRANPTDHIVRGLASRKRWEGLRRLTGVIETPSLRPDGSVINVPGYDPVTGHLYIPRCAYPPIPERPTLEDAQRALAALEDVFVDFPYGTQAGRSMAVSAVLTLIARPAIRGAVPAHLFDANTPGSGKTLQADVAVLIATGRDAGRKGFPTDQRGADDELGKVLCGYAIAGARVVNFDNIDGKVPFGGSSIESVLTSEDVAEFRLLGKNQILHLPWRALIMGSGNNVTISRDMVRRVMISRIESPYEKPELRPLSDFAHPERAFRLRDWTRENRTSLAVAALTLLRAHALAGRPGPNRIWGSFEAWTRVIADAIVWAGGADPLECRPRDDGDENPEKRAVAVVLREWGRLDSTGQGLTIKSALAALYSRERLRGESMPPDGFEELREALELLVPPKPRQPPDARMLGDVFRRYKRSVIGDRMLAVAPRPDRNGVARWIVAARAHSAPVQAAAPSEADDV